MTRCESYPPCFGTIYFPTAPSAVLLHVFVTFTNRDASILITSGTETLY